MLWLSVVISVAGIRMTHIIILKYTSNSMFIVFKHTLSFNKIRKFISFLYELESYIKEYQFHFVGLTAII